MSPSHLPPASLICEQLSGPDQRHLLEAIIQIIRQAPLYRPTMPRWGTPFSVQMTNCGSLGWVSDKSGYRYQPHHPETQKSWPPIPESLTQLWTRHTGYAHLPEACLINYYAAKARMGLHQDRDEHDFDAPVLSISLGDRARFRLGGLQRSDPSTPIDLQSGDVIMLSGPNRLAFHGIDRLYPGTSDLLAAHEDIFPAGGRLNLTLRRVAKP